MAAAVLIKTCLRRKTWDRCILLGSTTTPSAPRWPSGTTVQVLPVAAAWSDRISSQRVRRSANDPSSTSSEVRKALTASQVGGVRPPAASYNKDGEQNALAAMAL